MSAAESITIYRNGRRETTDASGFCSFEPPAAAVVLDGFRYAYRELYKYENGKATQMNTGTYSGGTPPHALKIKLSGTSIKIWFRTTLVFDETDSTHEAGRVFLAGDRPLFEDIKIGYDNNADDDIDDAGDDIIVDESFTSTEVTTAHDDAGNMVDDGIFRYTYDAWNRLVKVEGSTDNAAETFQTAEFDP